MHDVAVDWAIWHDMNLHPLDKYTGIRVYRIPVDKLHTLCAMSCRLFKVQYAWVMSNTPHWVLNEKGVQHFCWAVTYNYCTMHDMVYNTLRILLT